MREKQTERIKENDIGKRFQDVVPKSKPLEKQKKKINIYKQKLIDELYARIIEYEEEIKARHKIMEDPEIGKNWMKLKEIQDEIRNYELEIETMQTEIDERERELYSMEK
jgi:predicted RNase H-like nuclease (RuvC/YqgF family)